MKQLTSTEIRRMFLDFFVEKGHKIEPSASLVPVDDPTLLWINSGVATLKKYFDGREIPENPRITNSQKSIRTNDIENVGKTARHHTFFEMLGNFSIGDYFKPEAVAWAWEFLTSEKWLGLEKEKLSVTIHPEDTEAYDIWHNQIGLPEERIIRIEGNFWDIGEGPSGPNTEIFYDRGEETDTKSPKEEMYPGGENERYLEVWNVVFSQYNHNADGTYTELPAKNIDTGMGLERMACLIQGVDSIFDIDTIRKILDSVAQMAGVDYQAGNEQNDVSLRIITDHLRSMVFMIADGIMPSNEGRGYVLRRLIRRAARHGRLLGIEENNFLAKLMDSVVEVSGGAYPELVEKHDYIKKLIAIEEEQFAKTMDNGMGILEEYIAKLDKNDKMVLDGVDAFKLYDTYGFPVEMTEEILAERGITVDMDGFKENMDRQKELARQGQKSTEDVAWKDAADYDKLPKSKFLGYTEFNADAEVLYVNSSEGKNLLIFDRTPFYATSGGQLHDIGVIIIADKEYHVNDVTKENDVFLHFVDESVDNVNVGDTAELNVDVANRNRTARGHSATHILQQALKDVLGEHVSQAGSYVDNHYLRFDFNHFEAMTHNQIKEVEDIVNDKIDAFLPILMQEMPIEEAQKMGATAIFGEKYGEIVRVVSMGDYSVEFCGGTHIDNTGKIGAFKIISEAGIASGIRRIEAITGTQVIGYTEDKESVISNVCATLKSNASDIEKKAAQLVSDNKELEKTIKSLKADEIAGSLDEIIASGSDINGIKLITKRFDNTDVAQLREMADAIKSSETKSIFVAASVNDGKIAILVSVSDELVSEGFHAGKLVKEIAQVAGGNGGGKAGMAQAGAKDESKLEEAFELAKTLVANK